MITHIFNYIFCQEFHKEGSIILKSRFSSWGPRKVKSNAHFFSAFKMIEEEVRETGDSVIEQLFVEIFKDKESFVETMVDNLKKIEEVELEMTGGVKRRIDDIEDFSADEPEDLNQKINDLLTKFDEKDLVFITKFFKVIYKNNEQTLAISHPRIQKKAGILSYNLKFNGISLITDCAALTNLDSDIMSGRGNTGPAFCTLVPLKDMSEEVRQRVLDKFNMELIEKEGPSENSQDFPFAQSQTEDTLMICQVCRFATRDKPELKDHMQLQFQCANCSQYYLTKEELQHHEQNHKKVKCDQCSQEVRKDEMLNHNMNHLKLKSFGKKVIKKKVVKPVTGYGLWQKDARKRIVEENPGMVYTEVSRELGKRWALVEKKEKDLLKKQAEEFNKTLKATQELVVEDNVEQTDILASTSSNTAEASTSLETLAVVEDILASVSNSSNTSEGPSPVGGEEPILELESLEEVVGDETNAAIDDLLYTTNDNHLDADQLMNISIHSIQSEETTIKRKKSVVEKSTNCPLCDFTSDKGEELASHMKSQHKLTQSIFKSCHVCKQIFLQDNKLKEHMELSHNETNEAPPEIVLVKMRKLAWPAIVLKREGDIVEVKMMANDSVEVVPIDDIEAFNVEKISNTKNSRLKNAFAKAVEFMKK